MTFSSMLCLVVILVCSLCLVVSPVLVHASSKPFANLQQRVRISSTQNNNNSNSNETIPHHPMHPMSAGGSQLTAGQELVPSQYLQSPAGHYRLTFQPISVLPSGQLVLQDLSVLVGTSPLVMWSASVLYSPYLIMQSDCNLVAYGRINPATAVTAVWASNTYLRGTGCYLALQDDGNLVIYNGANQPLWATNTAFGEISASSPLYPTTNVHMGGLIINQDSQPLALVQQLNGQVILVNSITGHQYWGSQLYQYVSPPVQMTFATSCSLGQHTATGALTGFYSSVRPYVAGDCHLTLKDYSSLGGTPNALVQQTSTNRLLWSALNMNYQTSTNHYYFYIHDENLVETRSQNTDTNTLIMWAQINGVHVPGSPYSVSLGDQRPGVYLLDKLIRFTVSSPSDIVTMGYTIINHGGGLNQAALDGVFSVLKPLAEDGVDAAVDTLTDGVGSVLDPLINVAVDAVLDLIENWIVGQNCNGVVVHDVFQVSAANLNQVLRQDPNGLGVHAIVNHYQLTDGGTLLGFCRSKPSYYITAEYGFARSDAVTSEAFNIVSAQYPSGSASNLCLSVRDGASNNGASVTMVNCIKNAPSQLWYRAGTQLLSYANNLCLDITGANQNNGASLQLYQCLSDAQQQWNIPSSITSSVLTSTMNNKCLDIVGGVQVNGAAVQMYACNGNPQQKWLATTTPASFARNEIKSTAGWCIDIVGGNAANGAATQVWQCNGNVQQQWYYQSSTQQIHSYLNDLCLQYNFVQTGHCIGPGCAAPSNPNDPVGSLITVNTCVANTPSQTWQIITGTSHPQIQSAAHPSVCINIPADNNNGDRVSVWECGTVQALHSNLPSL